MNRAEKLLEFASLVARMREAQKKYFRCRQQSVLLDAKKLEAEVDKFLRDLSSPPSLPGMES